MTARVRCATCHRTELWTSTATGWATAVEVEGGSRRPSGAPQWARGRTLVAAARGDHGLVVGVCEACGQLLVAQDEGPPPMAVHVDTPQGRLTGEGERLEGPDGPMDPASAEAFLARQYAKHWSTGLVGDLGRSTFFVVLVPIIIGWALAVLFVGVFLASMVGASSETVARPPPGPPAASP